MCTVLHVHNNIHFIEQCMYTYSYLRTCMYTSCYVHGRFEHQGETTTHLEDLRESAEKQIDRLREDKDKLQTDFEEMKYSGEAKLSRYL